MQPAAAAAVAVEREKTAASTGSVLVFGSQSRLGRLEGLFDCSVGD